MIEAGLRLLLLAQPSITGIAQPQIIEGVTFQGVFNESIAQRFNPPFVLISQTSVDPLKALDGTYGLRFTDFDIDCYSRSYNEALQLGRNVETFLKDYTGPAGNADTIRAVLLEDSRYDSIFDGQGGDSRQHIVSLSFQIHHQPTNGT